VVRIRLSFPLSSQPNIGPSYPRGLGRLHLRNHYIGEPSVEAREVALVRSVMSLRINDLSIFRSYREPNLSDLLTSQAQCCIAARLGIAGFTVLAASAGGTQSRSV
jgi:hypothetical protein